MRFVSFVVKGKFGETSKSLKILWNCLQNFISLFLFWLAAPIVKNLCWYLGSNLGWYLLYLSKKCPKTNLKFLQYQILTLVKRSEKQLPSKANFSLFLLLTCSNFRLKLWDRHYSYQNCQKNWVWRGLWRIRSKKLFPETINHKIFEANSSFHVK